MRRLAIACLVLGSPLTGRDFGYDPAVPPGEAAEAIKAAELWWLEEGRKMVEEAGGR